MVRDDIAQHRPAWWSSMTPIEAGTVNGGLWLWTGVLALAAVCIGLTIRRRADLPSILLLSVGLAGLGYLIEVTWVVDTLSNRTAFALWRLTRMALIYILPAILWLRFHPDATTQQEERAIVPTPLLHRLGMRLPVNQAPWILGTGLLLYTVGLAAFILWPPHESGFTFWETSARWTDLAIVLPCICLMAAITDLWTRGFVLLQAADRWGIHIAVALQNALWLILHAYEIEILADSMTWTGAIALALFLGVTGDLVALRWRSVAGLMLGHAWLNIGWVLWLIL